MTWMDWLFTHFEIVAGVLIVGAALVWVLQQRRSPQSAMAWVMFIIMLPYVGVPLFFALGTRKRGSGYDRLSFAGLEALPPGGPDMAQHLRKLGVPGLEPGHRFRLETSPQEARETLVRLIDEAAESLDVTLYRLERDDMGRDFIERLTAAARRGVRVRLVLDRFGTWNRPRRALHRLREAGGKIELFSPIWRRGSFGRLNLRNHRKMVIADGRIAWSGGRNVGEPYLGQAEDWGTWTDLSYTLEGPAVRRFCEIFAADWAKLAPANGEVCVAPPPAGETRVQVIPSGPDMAHDGFHDALVHAIHTAKRRVWIATPYFLPTDQLGPALATAARVGIDLRILVPAKSNQPVADFARGAYLRELDDVGARVLLFTQGMMHAKAVIVDDMAFVGSSNLDIRSMLLNFETMLGLYDPPEVAAVADWFEGLERHCALGARAASFPRKMAESLLRLGAPIL